MVKLSAGSICRSPGRWRLIWADSVGGRRWGRALARWIRVRWRGSNSDGRRALRGSHGDAVARFGHAAQDRRMAVTGEAICASRKPKGSRRWVTGVMSSVRRWRFFYPKGYPLAVSMNPDGGSMNRGAVRSPAVKVYWRSDLLQSWYCTMVNTSLEQLTEQLQSHFSPNS
jgi:hypothetical protein